MRSQVPIKAVCNYRADFMLCVNSRSLVIECDGRSYHDFIHDQHRDVDLLMCGGIDQVFRFRGIDINHAPRRCANEIVRFAPYLKNPEAADLSLEEACLAASSFVGRHDKTNTSSIRRTGRFSVPPLLSASSLATPDAGSSSCNSSHRIGTGRIPRRRHGLSANSYEWRHRHH